MKRWQMIVAMNERNRYQKKLISHLNDKLDGFGNLSDKLWKASEAVWLLNSADGLFGVAGSLRPVDISGPARPFW